MAEREEIILDVIPDAAVAGANVANRAVENFEKTADRANRGASRHFERTGTAIVQVTDKSTTSINKMMRALERRADRAGRSPMERLIAEREKFISQLGGDQALIQKASQYYDKLAASQEKAAARSRDSAAAMRQSSEQTRSLGQWARDTAVNLGLLYTAQTLIRKTFKEGIVDSTLYAARTETLGVAMRATAKASNLSVVALEGYEQKLKSLGIATQEAREGLARIAAAGIPVESAPGLARLAQNVAVLKGIDSSEAFSRLVYGIQSGETEVLKHIGLAVTFEAAYTKATRKIGRELTDLEKVHVRLNEVMAMAPRFAGLYEDAMGSVGKQMASLTRHFNEARNAVGEQFLPELRLVVGTLTELAQLIQANPSIGTFLAAIGGGGAAAIGAKVLFGATAAKAVGLGAAAGGVTLGGRALGQEIGFRATEAFGAVRPSTRQGGIDLLATAEKRRQDLVEDAARNARKQAEDIERKRVAQGEIDQKQQAEAQKIIDRDSKTAHGLLIDAQKREYQGLAQILGQYAIYRNELKLSAQGQRDLAEATRLRLKVDAEKELKRNSADAIADVEKQSDARREFLSRQYEQEQAFSQQTLNLSLDSARQRFDFEETASNQRRDAELRALEGLNAQTVQQKLAVESQRAAIEEKYLVESLAHKASALDLELQMEVSLMEQVARIRGISEESIAARRNSIVEQYGEQGRQLEARIQADINTTRENAAIRSSQIVADHQQRQFDSLKRSAEGIFDALLSRSRSFGQTLMDIMRTAFLTPVKEFASNYIATLLMPLYGGSGGGRGGASGGFGALGSMGMASMIGPGGTSGFTGPVGGMGGGGLGGFGGGAGLAGMGANLKGMLGIGGSISTGAGTATTWGAATFGQKLGALGKSDAALMGGGMLAMDGLRRGGALGLAETTGGGALIGYKFGGPIGAAIGAGAGLTAGIIRLFVKGAAEKARKKINEVYRIDVQDKGILQQIVDTAKSAFGGNIDVAIHSPQIRDLIQLYGMSTGQNGSGFTSKMQPASLRQFGGSLYQMPTYSNGSALPSLGGLPTMGGAPAATIQLDKDGTKEFWQQVVSDGIVGAPREVAAATATAFMQNASRRVISTRQFSPGLVTS